MTPLEDDADMQFDCPLCGGAFEASRELLGQEVECPHCGQAVELPRDDLPNPTAVEQSADPAESQSPVGQTATASEPASRRPLSRKQREAARRRFNVALAAVGAAVLVIVFITLVRLS